MDRYQKVQKPKQETPIQENEIRITTQGLVRNYVSYGISLLQDKHAKEVTLKGMGQAINKAVVVVEFLKKQFPNLHQDTSVSSVSITDVWEPIEEGLLPVETTHLVSMIMISLSTRGLDKNSPGYQAPNHDEETESVNQQQHPRPVRDSYNAGYGESYGQARGSGRGHGWGRGFGDYYQGENYHRKSYDQGYAQGHDGGYDQGRGRGYERGRRGGFLRGRLGGYERGRGGYDRGRGSGHERGQVGDYDRGQGDGYYGGQRGGYERGRGSYSRIRGDYKQGQGGSYEGGQGVSAVYGYGSGRGDYARERRGCDQGNGGIYEGRGGGIYGRSRGYARGGGGYEGQGAEYEQGRGGYGRGRGRSGGRSRGGVY